MIIKGIIKKGRYFDSVTLMIAAHKIKQIPGVLDSAVVMGSKENKTILDASGFLIAEFQGAEDTDLLVAVQTASEEIAARVLEDIDTTLKSLAKRSETPGHVNPRSLDAAIESLPGANLVLISLPGKYAADEAMKALEKGLHVMLFSDNVPLEKEIRLKQYAQAHDLLVMGPDCGTAIINGVPLAFANVVRPGNIGVVAASGTGLQEVTCLISNSGAGISQAIGTGGRDVKKEVGGITFISALNALAEDPNTHAILLVSKPPHPDVLAKIGQQVTGIKKPVAAVFLGADSETVKSFGITPASDLEEGARIILELAGTGAAFPPALDIETIAARIRQKLNKEQKYLRALFSGGTFCGETQVILKELPGIYSNAPTANSVLLKDSRVSEKHTVVDLGSDEFTVGKPHPMIDFSTRNERIIREANDKETAVILLDLVLGYGANLDPLPELLPVIKQAKETAAKDGREIPIVCSVTGTDEDPQNKSRVAAALKEAGVIVCRSNAEAAKLCKHIFAVFSHKGTQRSIKKNDE